MEQLKTHLESDLSLPKMPYLLLVLGLDPSFEKVVQHINKPAKENCVKY